MRGLNQHTVAGTVGNDPEIKYAANGNAIANLNLAVNEEWTDKNTGEKQQRTDWIRVVIFGKLAEICGQYVTKGSQLLIVGKVKTRKWQDQNGQDRYSTETVVDIGGTMQMLGGKSDGNAKADSQAQAYGQFTGQQPPQTQNNQGFGGGQNNGQMQQPQQTMQQNQPMNTGNPQPNDFDDAMPF